MKSAQIPHPQAERAKRIEKLGFWLFQRDILEAKSAGAKMSEYAKLQSKYLAEAGRALEAVDGPILYPFSHLKKDDLSESGKPGV